MAKTKCSVIRGRWSVSGRKKLLQEHNKSRPRDKKQQETASLAFPGDCCNLGKEERSPSQFRVSGILIKSIEWFPLPSAPSLLKFPRSSLYSPGWSLYLHFVLLLLVPASAARVSASCNKSGNERTRIRNISRGHYRFPPNGRNSFNMVQLLRILNCNAKKFAKLKWPPSKVFARQRPRPFGFINYANKFQSIYLVSQQLKIFARHLGTLQDDGEEDDAR